MRPMRARGRARRRFGGRPRVAPRSASEWAVVASWSRLVTGFLVHRDPLAARVAHHAGMGRDASFTVGEDIPSLHTLAVHQRAFVEGHGIALHAGADAGRVAAAG